VMAAVAIFMGKSRLNLWLFVHTDLVWTAMVAYNWDARNRRPNGMSVSTTLELKDRASKNATIETGTPKGAPQVVETGSEPVPP
jgi:hypothetical protein